MLNIEELFHSTKATIDSFNSKLQSGNRLSDEESSEFSKALKIFPNLEETYNDIHDLNFAKENPETFDQNFINTLEEKIKTNQEVLEKKIHDLNKEEIDKFILEMRAGAGGEEASLFCRQLFNAYSKFCLSLKGKIEIVDYTETESGGFSTIVAQVSSTSLYEYIKNEGGVHRVQRVPKTESSGRVHTSTISVAILPIRKQVEVKINPNDLRIDVYRSSGHGGQSVNTTDSAVRITHLPTGLVVTCQNTKSQIKNKEIALQVLLARLDEIERNKVNGDILNIRNQQIGNMDRSEKIRTYNFMQDRITDHRVKKDFSNIEKFMQGEMQNVLDEINTALVFA